MCRFCNNRAHAPAELGSGSGKIIAAPANMPAGVGDPDRLTLIRAGAVLSMDTAVGNFSKGDVLIRGSRIVEVAASINAPEAAIIGASRPACRRDPDQ